MLFPSATCITDPSNKAHTNRRNQPVHQQIHIVQHLIMLGAGGGGGGVRYPQNRMKVLNTVILFFVCG